ncbi:D-alanyl-alanine synthetase [Picosynechococcus sp. PCC 73109]|uniref:D-alanine--D-alanine ligase family protein n=2 Tax=Picosynechococcus sp. PCC 73109 TaxID=374982 RepID=UPI00074588AB|nr:D-alanyl-alanine synthetase [Picosynechococcus sp. PCC 73109]AMA08429.1 D-alanyl-alanine synthetase [Picosynechococcus sp. PCC 73109]
MMGFVYDFSQLPNYLEILRKKLRIAVIHGGDKAAQGAVIYQTHNPRSTKTYEVVAHDIAAALEDLGFQHVFVLPDDSTLGDRLRKHQIHLAWLNTGGVQGYNPVCHTPAILEMLGVPYIGHNPLNSSILDNKHSFKRELQGLGFPTAPFMIWHPAQGQFTAKDNARFQQTFGDYQGSFLVKPVSGRASLNIHFVDQPQDLGEAIANIHQQTHNTALIEPFLTGREFCVSVCGYVRHRQGRFEKLESPFTFSILERLLEADEKIFTSMDKKAITGQRIRFLDDSDPAKKKLAKLAQQVYWEFSLNALIRIDARMDAMGNIQILEANPKPDLKRPAANVTSLVAQGLSEEGMTYEDLILSLISDRLDYLLTNHAQIIPHITALLNP